MSRNNQDRLGPTVQSADAPPAQQAASTNSQPLQFVVPTEFVELPTAGKFYAENHPFHNKSEIEIKFMTAKEEDILTDKTLLKKGIALDRLLKSLLVDKGVNPDSLFVADKNAILIGARKSGYGSSYDTKVMCPVCFAHGRHEFDLDDAIISAPKNLEDGAVQLTEAGTLLFTTPTMGVEVECRMLTGADEKTILNKQKNNKKLNLPENALTTQLKTILVSVNGNTERSYINSFVDACTAMDSRFIRGIYQNSIPNVELKEEYVCGECDTSTMIDVPFTTDFFWPQR